MYFLSPEFSVNDVVVVEFLEHDLTITSDAAVDGPGSPRCGNGSFSSIKAAPPKKCFRWTVGKLLATESDTMTGTFEDWGNQPPADQFGETATDTAASSMSPRGKRSLSSSTGGDLPAGMSVPRARKLLRELTAELSQLDGSRMDLEVRRAQFAGTHADVTAESVRAKAQLDSAQQAVALIDPSRLQRELRSYRVPPPVAVLVLEATVVMLMAEVPAKQRMSWEEVHKRAYSNRFVLEVVESSTRNLMTSQRCRAVAERYLKEPEFNLEAVTNASRVLVPLYQWVVAQVALRQAVDSQTEASAKLQDVTSRLQEKQAQCEQMQARIDAVQAYVRDHELQAARRRKGYSEKILLSSICGSIQLSLSISAGRMSQSSFGSFGFSSPADLTFTEVNRCVAAFFALGWDARVASLTSSIREEMQCTISILEQQLKTCALNLDAAEKRNADLERLHHEQQQLAAAAYSSQIATLTQHAASNNKTISMELAETNQRLQKALSELAATKAAKETEARDLSNQLAAAAEAMGSERAALQEQLQTALSELAATKAAKETEAREVSFRLDRILEERDVLKERECSLELRLFEMDVESVLAKDELRTKACELRMLEYLLFGAEGRSAFMASELLTLWAETCTFHYGMLRVFSDQRNTLLWLAKLAALQTDEAYERTRHEAAEQSCVLEIVKTLEPRRVGFVQAKFHELLAHLQHQEALQRQQTVAERGTWQTKMTCETRIAHLGDEWAAEKRLLAGDISARSQELACMKDRAEQLRDSHRAELRRLAQVHDAELETLRRVAAESSEASQRAAEQLRQDLEESTERQNEMRLQLERTAEEIALLKCAAAEKDAVVHSLTLRLAELEQQLVNSADSQVSLREKLLQNRLSTAQELAAAAVKVTVAEEELLACKRLAETATTRSQQLEAEMEHLRESQTQEIEARVAASSEKSVADAARIGELETQLADLSLLLQAMNRDAEVAVDRLEAAGVLSGSLGEEILMLKSQLASLEAAAAEAEERRLKHQEAAISRLRGQLEQEFGESVSRARNASLRLSRWIQSLLDRLSELSAASDTAIAELQHTKRLHVDTVNSHRQTLASLEEQLCGSQPLKLLLLSTTIQCQKGDDEDDDPVKSAARSIVADLERDHEDALRSAVEATVASMRRQRDEISDRNAQLSSEVSALSLRALAAEAEVACVLRQLEARTAELQTARAAASQSLAMVSSLQCAHGTELAAWEAKYVSLAGAWDCHLRDSAARAAAADVAITAAQETLRQLKLDHEAAGKAASDVIAAHVLKEREHWATRNAETERMLVDASSRAETLGGECHGLRARLRDMSERLEKSLLGEQCAVTNAAVNEANRRQLSEALVKCAGAIAERDAWMSTAADRGREADAERARSIALERDKELLARELAQMRLRQHETVACHECR
jgi:hypothetical protein